MKKTYLFIFGTRPEAIKLAPLIIKFIEKKEKVFVCNTGQHRDLVDDVLTLFDIKIDFDLQIMKENQNLFSLTSNLISKIKNVLEISKPNYVFVHGDTTTCFASSLATFYSKLKLVHVEAGLRTNNKYSPFPEEMNRQLVSKMADIHLCPTSEAKQNLLEEGVVTHKIFITGNTVVDALLLAKDKINIQDKIDIKKLINKEKFILFTGHRRENFGDGFKNIFEALLEIAKNNLEVQIIYPVHPNPNVKKEALRLLGKIPNISLTDPVKYGDFIWLMENCELIITDSGGIQEEAPSFNKIVVVTRESTERTESLVDGNSIIVGSDKQKLIETVNELLHDVTKDKVFIKSKNPFGSGQACEQIYTILNAQ
jgi:UDP-N-acetylglucosamine 2-epimerase (non-hydrolysing)